MIPFSSEAEQNPVKVEVEISEFSGGAEPTNKSKWQESNLTETNHT